MYPDQVKANMTINVNNIPRKLILLNLSIIERNMEFKPLLAHIRC